MISGSRLSFLLFCCSVLLFLFPERGTGGSPRIVGSETGRTYHVFCLDSGAPYIFRDSAGELAGMYVDILSSLGEREGLKLSLSSGDGREARRNVHLGKIDAVAGCLYPTLPDSEIFGYLPVKNLDPQNRNLSVELDLLTHRLSGKELLSYVFTLPFLREPATFFFPGREAGGTDTLRGKTVLVAAESQEERHLSGGSLPVSLLREESPRTVLAALAAGRGHGAFLGAYQGIKISREMGREQDISPLRPFPYLVAKGIAVLKGQSALALQFFRGLDAMERAGEIDRIRDRWISEFEPSVFSMRQIWNWAGAGALLLCAFLAWNMMLKRKVTIIVKEREKILDFIRDGILAVDRDGKITMINRAARTLLGLSHESVGKEADLCIPGLSAGMILAGGRPVYDHQQNLNGALLSCSKVPVIQAGRTVGAIITMRDMSELQAMAEEITGVRTYVESLRVQGHEFMNKLQAISGLIQLRRYDRAIEFIASETDSRHSATAFMTERIKNAAVCGVLMGKAGRCRELGIQFCLDPESFCCDRGGEINDRSLVIIVGNLLQNAIEALEEKGIAPGASVDFSIFDESGHILISVCDNAGTLTDEGASRLFEKGFTTKKKAELSGFGLYNIKTIVDALGGTITADYETGNFTEFTVSLPVSSSADPCLKEVF
ncbi:PAS domain-containing protein [Aminivibrio pyruvatiphilus]|uniref:histidine kinase n=2 Tax=Aminivibrio TaxID=1427172 RepID=A0A4R8M7F1_9BACT|nr:PAS domain-containing protein [Aminivibrio pyruvatiphilus]